jgi:hypothetical protein
MPDIKDLHAAQYRASQQRQAAFDPICRQVGLRAPMPTFGQHPADYDREMLRNFKKTFLIHHDLYRVNMRSLDDSVLPQFTSLVCEAVVKEAYNPLNVPKGEMRKVERLDELGRVSEIHWIGQESFVKEMGRPGRRVVAFNTRSELPSQQSRNEFAHA